MEIRLDAKKNTINLGKRIVGLVEAQIEIKQMTFSSWLLKPWLNLILVSVTSCGLGDFDRVKSKAHCCESYMHREAAHSSRLIAGFIVHPQSV